MEKKPKGTYQVPKLRFKELDATYLMIVASEGDAIYNRDYNLHYGGIDETGEMDPE